MTEKSLLNAQAQAPPAAKPELRKRFYTSATFEQNEGMWCVLLDGRSVRTPDKHLLRVPSQTLAAALAAEWEAQVDAINPEAMPLTRIVNTALDGVSNVKDKVRDEIAKFAGDDLLCYRAEHPQDLIDRQNLVWDAPLAWLKERHEITFQTGAGLMPIRQQQKELHKFRHLLNAYETFHLAALHTVVTLTGSAVLGYAVLTGHLTKEEAWRAAHVDEDWQISKWGADAEAKARRAYRWREYCAAVEIMNAVPHL